MNFRLEMFDERVDVTDLNKLELLIIYTIIPSMDPKIDALFLFWKNDQIQITTRTFHDLFNGNMPHEKIYKLRKKELESNSRPLSKDQQESLIKMLDGEIIESYSITGSVIDGRSNAMELNFAGGQYHYRWEIDEQLHGSLKKLVEFLDDLWSE